jgi:hypothetical protein
LCFGYYADIEGRLNNQNSIIQFEKLSYTAMNELGYNRDIFETAINMNVKQHQNCKGTHHDFIGNTGHNVAVSATLITVEGKDVSNVRRGVLLVVA